MIGTDRSVVVAERNVFYDWVAASSKQYRLNLDNATFAAVSPDYFDRTVHAPTDRERALLDRLLAPEFRGCVELRAQARHLYVAWITSSGAPALRLHVPAGPLAPLDLQRIPVEGSTQDDDGLPIHILLHVEDGLLREIELFREDGGRLQRFPDMEDIAVTIN